MEIKWGFDNASHHTISCLLMEDLPKLLNRNGVVGQEYADDIVVFLREKYEETVIDIL